MYEHTMEARNCNLHAAVVIDDLANMERFGNGSGYQALSIAVKWL
jgi:hypothetical protein